MLCHSVDENATPLGRQMRHHTQVLSIILDEHFKAMNLFIPHVTRCSDTHFQAPPKLTSRRQRKAFAGGEQVREAAAPGQAAFRSGGETDHPGRARLHACK